MARHRAHNIEFKRQAAQDYLAGETLHSLARRHDLSRNLIRIWIQKFDAGVFEDEAIAADTTEAYDARIAARCGSGRGRRRPRSGGRRRLPSFRRIRGTRRQ
ncbi:MAG: transposase [Rhizobiales bacterium]|nr:transposase [Hyphomicrobiales bacterium]